MQSNFLRYKSFILDILFPIDCLGCQEEETWLCDKCFQKLAFRESDEHKSKINQKEKIYYDKILAAGDYKEKLLKNVIKTFKYRFSKDLAKTLANFLFLFLRAEAKKLTPIDLNNPFGENYFFADFRIIPVPLHKRREKWRGFNQSELLGRELADLIQSEICLNKLKRLRYTKSQAKLNYEERRKNLKGCFAWQGEELAGQNIILLDDVVSTGATLNECAKILKENGAGEVWAAAIAN